MKLKKKLALDFYLEDLDITLMLPDAVEDAFVAGFEASRIEAGKLVETVRLLVTNTSVTGEATAYEINEGLNLIGEEEV